MKNPRKFVIADSALTDPPMYVADWANGRIIRIAPDADGTFSSSGQTNVVLGSVKCATSGCPTLCSATGCPAPLKIADNSNDGDTDGDPITHGWFKFFPSAIEIVPDVWSGTARYFVAFSSGNEVYLLAPVDGDSTPNGKKGEKIYRIAGNGSAPVTYAGASASFMNSSAGVQSANAQGSPLCPIIDLKFDIKEKVLYAASSCSLQTDPSVAADLSRNTGAIIRIIPEKNGFATTDTNSISTFAGGMWIRPCAAAGRCSEPSADGSPGIYQRKIDLGASTAAEIAAIDIINPVDLAWGPGNSLLFIDQWNAGPHCDKTLYPRLPNCTDEQHQQGVYMIDRAIDGTAKAIIPITNPAQYGNNTIPVESAYWRSPYTGSGVLLLNERPDRTQSA